MSQLTIAVIGASPHRHKFGNKAVRAYRERGWQVFPINPNARQVEGLTAYPSLRAIPPVKLDRVSVYLPPEIGLRVVDEIAAVGCGELWLNPGADSPELVRQAQGLGLNVVRGCSIVDIGISPHDLD